MVCDAYGYACYINDRLVQKKKHRLHSLVNAVAVQDEDRIYLKMVNVDDEEKEIQIYLDCEVEERVLTEVVSAAPGEVNSFEDKEHVSSVCGGDFRGERNSYTRIPAHSVNVLVMKKK